MGLSHTGGWHKLVTLLLELEHLTGSVQRDRELLVLFWVRTLPCSYHHRRHSDDEQSLAPVMPKLKVSVRQQTPLI